MKVKKDEIVRVQGGRGKGFYTGKAFRDFDTETDDWYPIITLDHVIGINNEWIEGEQIPCRKGIDRIIEILENI